MYIYIYCIVRKCKSSSCRQSGHWFKLYVLFLRFLFIFFMHNFKLNWNEWNETDPGDSNLMEGSLIWKFFEPYHIMLRVNKFFCFAFSSIRVLCVWVVLCYVFYPLFSLNSPPQSNLCRSTRWNRCHSILIENQRTVDRFGALCCLGLGDYECACTEYIYFNVHIYVVIIKLIWFPFTGLGSGTNWVESAEIYKNNEKKWGKLFNILPL